MILLSCIRTPFFEFFIKSHLSLAILIVYAVWRHLTGFSSLIRLYVIIAAAIYAFTSVIRYIRLLYRQWSWSQPYATAQVLEIQKSNDALCLQIKVRRPWNIRAGQFVYLWIPFCSFWSFFQTHPFTVSWWDQDSDGRGAVIYVLLKPMHGRTAKLARHAGAVALKTWIDGPYGGGQDLGEYGSILMFASGIGIAAQVPYIKELLRSIHESKVKTRSILLIWQLEKESKLHFASEVRKLGNWRQKVIKNGCGNGWISFSRKTKVNLSVFSLSV